MAFDANEISTIFWSSHENGLKCPNLPSRTYEPITQPMTWSDLHFDCETRMLSGNLITFNSDYPLNWIYTDGKCHVALAYSPKTD